MRRFIPFGKAPIAAYLKSTPDLWNGQGEEFLGRQGAESSASVSPKDKIHKLLFLANATLSGAALTRAAIAARTTIKLDYRRAARSAVIAGTPSVITLSAKDGEDMLANMYVHEARHDLQMSRIKNALGRRDAFEKRAVTFADKAIAPLIMEGVAFAEQTINAYELMSLGIGGPWMWMSFNFRFQPLVETLLQKLEHCSLHSDAMKLALFDAWMTRSVLRLGYDLDHLKYAYVHYENFRNHPSVSFSHEDLWCIADDPNGKSYLSGVDVKASSYLGVWNEISTREELREAAVSLARREIFLNAYGNANEIVEILEDYLECRGRWSRLPPDYSPAQVMQDQCLKQFGNAARRACCALQVVNDEPEGAERLHRLLDRAQGIADRHVALSSFAAAVDEGWQAFRHLAASKRQRAAEPV